MPHAQPEIFGFVHRADDAHWYRLMGLGDEDRAKQHAWMYGFMHAGPA